MRLTLLNQFYKPDISPTAHLAASLAEHRAAMGDEVTVVASGGGYVGSETPEVREEREARERRGTENPRILRMWTPKLGKKSIIHRLTDYGSFYAQAMRTMLALPPQDVIISLTTPPYIALTALAHKRRHQRRGHHARLVLWNMDCYPDAAERLGMLKHGGAVSRAMRATNRRMFRQLDALVSLDTAMQDLLVGQYLKDVPPEKQPLTRIIPNWEPLDLFPRDAAVAPWGKARDLGLEGKFVVLYLGNMGTGHDFDTILDAADRLRDEPVAFLFVGGGFRFEQVRTAARLRSLANVLTHPYVPKEQTPEVMALAGAALITLDDSALGVMSPSKLHANLAASLPVLYIGPERSNVDDAIRNFNCGKSLRLGDVEGAIGFIRTLLNDEPARARYRAAARDAFESAYCDRRTLPQFDALLEKLVRDGSGH